MWTLTDQTGLETSLADLGITNCTLQRVSQSQDSCTFDLALAYDQPDPWQYGDTLKIQRDRTGSRHSYSGGSIWFVGRVMTEPKRANPSAETISIRIAGPWFYLDQLVYQQPWYVTTNTANPPSSKTSGYKSHVFLNMGVDGAHLTSDWQIWDAVNYAIGAGAPMQIPTAFASYPITNPSDPTKTVFIDGPDPSAFLPVVDPPFDEAKDIMCSEVIRRQIRWTPDALTWFDYLTSPPTFHCERKQNMVVATLDMADPARITDQLDIGARRDIRVPAVVLKYEQTYSWPTDGVSYLITTVDMYPNWDITGQDPAHADQYHPYTQGTLAYLQQAEKYERMFSSFVSTIDLMGFSETTLKGTLKVQALPANFNSPASLDNPFADEWWGQWAPFLRQPNVAIVSIDNAVRQLETQPPTVPGTLYTHELVEGQIAPWMTLGSGAPVASQREVITADVTYESFDTSDQSLWPVTDAAGNRIHLLSHRTEPVSHSCVTTNAVTGTYSAVADIQYPEAVPVGLAKELYIATNALQWEGQVSFVEQELTGSIRPGMVLNIANGNSEWATMLALVQQTTENVDEGRTTLQLGPATHLGPADLIELLRVNRLRFLYTNPASRITARDQGSSAGSALGSMTTNQDTSAGASQYKKIKLQVQNADGSVTECFIDVDAIAKQLNIVIPDITGASPTNRASMITGGLMVLGNQANRPSSPTKEPVGGFQAGQTIIINKDDLQGKNQVAWFQPVIVCVDDGTGKLSNMKAWLLMTKPEAL